MVDFIKVDTREIDIMLFKLRRKMPKLIPAVMRGYVNSMGAQTKKNSEKVLDQKFNFSNNSTKRFTNKGVHFTKARKGDQNPQSEVGATGDLNSNTLKGRKASYLARQELGGNVSQVKRAGGVRRNLIAPNPKHNKKRVLMRNLRAKAAKPTKGLSERRAMASALQNARSNNKKLAFTPYGIYKVLKRSAKLMYIYKPKDSIKTPQKRWLQPSVDMTMKRRNTIMRKEIIFRIQKEMEKK